MRGRVLNEGSGTRSFSWSPIPCTTSTRCSTCTRWMGTNASEAIRIAVRTAIARVQAATTDLAFVQQIRYGSVHLQPLRPAFQAVYIAVPQSTVENRANQQLTGVFTTASTRCLPGADLGAGRTELGAAGSASLGRCSSLSIPRYTRPVHEGSSTFGLHHIADSE